MADPQLAVVADAAYRRRAGTAAPADLDVLDQVGLQPLSGGLNNALYRLRHAGRDLCLKMPVVDSRRRAEREWTTLTLLAHRGHPRVPHPVWRSPWDDGPAIAMTFVAGEPLGDADLLPQQLDAITEALADLYSITPADVREPVAEVATPAPAMLHRIRAAWAAPDAAHDPAHQQAVQLWQRWAHGPDPETILCGRAAQVLGRGDPSLANVLWDGAQVTLLDFEYSGWTDPAYELADLVEHPQSRATPDQTWHTYINRFPLDPAAQARHRAARRMLALFWLARWSPGSARHTAQEHRVEHLLSDAP
jgi:hypothetical protein